MRNKDKPWFDDQCRHAFGLKQEAHLRWTRDRTLVDWEKFVSCQVRANETYSEAKRQFTVRNRDVLMNTQSHKWWSTLKSVVFGLSSQWCASNHPVCLPVMHFCASPIDCKVHGEWAGG